MKPNEVIHLYWYNQDSASSGAKRYVQLLDEAEMERYRSIKHLEQARQFAYRRGLLKCLLAQHCGVSAVDLNFETGPNGKPFLTGDYHHIHFNTSHSKTSGVVAVCQKGPIGVDVERIRQLDVVAFSEKILSPSERQEFQAVPENEKQTAIFKYWTAKEALLKAQGLALNLNLLRQISTDISGRDAQWSSVKLADQRLITNQWYLSIRTSLAWFPQPAIVAVASQQKRPITVHSADEVLS